MKFYMYDVVGNLLGAYEGYGKTPLGNASSTRNSIRKAVNAGKTYKGYYFTVNPREDDLGHAGDKISDYVERYAEMINDCEKGIDSLTACKNHKVQMDVPPMMILAWIAGLDIETEGIDTFMRQC